MKRCLGFLLLLVIVLSLISCSNSSGKLSINVGQTISINDSFILKSKPEPSLAENSITTNMGENYKVVEIDGIYAKITSNEKSGWLPIWYLSVDAKDITECNPNVYLINNKTKLYLTPENSENNTDDYYLEEGQAVEVVKKYKDWYNVKFILYDYSNTGDRWIESKYVTDYSDDKCKEGKIKQGCEIYDNEFNVIPGETFKGAVRILDQLNKPNTNDRFYLVSGAGGFSGLIKKGDFVPNPFIEN
jgi:hypothetical protein